MRLGSLDASRAPGSARFRAQQALTLYTWAIDVEDPQLALQSSLPHVEIAFDFNIDDAGGFAFQYKRGGFRIYPPRPDIAMFPFF